MTMNNIIFEKTLSAFWRAAPTHLYVASRRNEQKKYDIFNIIISVFYEHVIFIWHDITLCTVFDVVLVLDYLPQYLCG